MCIIAFMLIFNVEISYSISYYEISILRKNTGNITGNEENNTMELHITCIPGDGIGPEIVRETKKVLDKVAHKYGHKMIYKDILMGGASIDVHGVPLTEEAIADAKAADAVLMGSIGGNTTTSPWYKLPPEKRPEAGLLAMRKALNLFANLRPAVLYDELAAACPLKEEISKAGFDMLIMRELTGGLYFGERRTIEVDLITAATPEGPIVIDNGTVTERLQQNPLAYDKDGEMHYDIISAFIKSIRGSDPDAALYWLARMIEGGEDPKFIARRLVISAAEDIGLANPNALLLANAAFDAVQKIGWPEGRIPLAEATVYLATSAKSNSAYKAIDAAIQLVRSTGNAAVPLHLRNAPTNLMAQLGYHDGYIYPHDYPEHFARQQYMPDTLQGNRFWTPADNAQEAKIRERMSRWWGDGGKNTEK